MLGEPLGIFDGFAVMLGDTLGTLDGTRLTDGLLDGVPLGRGLLEGPALGSRLGLRLTEGRGVAMHVDVAPD